MHDRECVCDYCYYIPMYTTHSFFHEWTACLFNSSSFMPIECLILTLQPPLVLTLSSSLCITSIPLSLSPSLLDTSIGSLGIIIGMLRTKLVKVMK